jgi:hypothetical protein
MVCRALACISLVASITWSAPSRAQDGPAPEPTPSTAPAAEALPVTIKLVSTPLQVEAVRAALETELKVPVRVDDVLGDEGLSVAVKWRRTTVSYRAKNGEVTTRSLDLPANSEQAVEVIALLAGNLARDEASELLARLAPPPSPEPEVAPAEPAPAEGAPPSPPVESAPPAEPAKKAEEPEKPRPPPKKPAAKPTPPDALVRDVPLRANLTLWYPTMLLSDTERRVLAGELGLAYSRVGAIEGAGFAGGYLRVERHVRGAIGSFGYTRSGGDVVGFQGGLIASEGQGNLRGGELALFGTLRWGNVQGLQMATLVTTAKNVTGAQVSSGVSIGDDVRGAQVALVSVARDVTGAQLELAGFARDVQGGQLGLVNAGRDVDGAQLGLVNVARSVDVQLGLVNVAKRVDVASLGLVSIAGNGYVEPTVYGIFGDRDSMNAGVKFVAGYTYSLLSIGGTDELNGDLHTRTEAGGGVHYEPKAFRDGPIVDRVAVELGGHVGHTWANAVEEEDILHYRASAGLRLFGLLWLFVGYDLSHDLVPFGKDVGEGSFVGLSLF